MIRELKDKWLSFALNSLGSGEAYRATNFHHLSAKQNTPDVLLVDYFEYLKYSKYIPKRIAEPDYFEDLYAECFPLITVLSKKINRNNKQEIYTPIIESPDKFSKLIEGYTIFVKELEQCQILWYSVYTNHNHKLPVLIIPFSYGLNKVSNNMIFMKDSDNGGLIAKEYKLEDTVVRLGIDLGIRLYHYEKHSETFPTPWIEAFRSSFKEDGMLTALQFEKMKDIYSQYSHSGIKLNEFGEPTDEIYTISNSSNIKVLLNYPFLTKTCRAEIELPKLVEIKKRENTA